MKTFFNLLQTIINKKYKIYPDEPFNLLGQIEPDYCKDNIFFYIDHLIYNIYQNTKQYMKQHTKKTENIFIINSKSKLNTLNSILNNLYYGNELKERIFTIYSKAQRHYNAFSRLARIYKYKKYPFVVTDDLTMNPLIPTHRNTFILIEDKSKYMFNLNELISIIETAISNSPNFFSEPLSPCNPYTNQKLTHSTLYNIYFKMKHSGRVLSILFHFFFLEQFNKLNFSEHYEACIREYAIKKYVFNSPYTVLHATILEMIKSNMYTKNYKIHNDFPKDKLVEIFRPFLFYYYISIFDIKGTSKVYVYKQILNIKLKYFYQYNKAFGRKYIKLSKNNNKVINKEYIFNTEHLSFYKLPFDYTPEFTSYNINMLFRRNVTVNNNVTYNLFNNYINNYINNSINNSINNDNLNIFDNLINNNDIIEESFIEYNSETNDDSDDESDSESNNDDSLEDEDSIS
jgi:hypothetical protein